jgi:pimeloyl-ACP methyl ester carboxylesterase
MICGGPTDAEVFSKLADLMSERFQVVTYDPRGNSRSTFDGLPVEQDMDVHGDDAAKLIGLMGAGPAVVFGNSGGAQIGLNLAARHGWLVKTLVAHEPPCVSLLPDASEVLRKNDEVHEIYKSQGVCPAMGAFMKMAGMPPPSVPSEVSATSSQRPGPSAKMQANLEYFFAHGIRSIAGYRPDIEALKKGQPRIVVGVGSKSEGQLASRCGIALAQALGTRLMLFPGGHGGYAQDPAGFAKILEDL